MDTVLPYSHILFGILIKKAFSGPRVKFLVIILDQILLWSNNSQATSAVGVLRYRQRKSQIFSKLLVMQTEGTKEVGESWEEMFFLIGFKTFSHKVR